MRKLLSGLIFLISPLHAEELPKFYFDGVHDDAPALQAMTDGKIPSIDIINKKMKMCTSVRKSIFPMKVVDSIVYSYISLDEGIPFSDSEDVDFPDFTVHIKIIWTHETCEPPTS